MRNQLKKIGLGLIVAAAFVPFAVHAGSENEKGNGGGAWVCREQNEKIRWAALVDLFEAKNEFGLEIAQYPGSSVREVLDQAMLRLLRADREFFDQLNPELSRLNYLEPRTPGVTYVEDELEVIDDSLYRLRPGRKRCVGGTITYEQVVNYKNDGTLLVQSDLFHALPISHRAAHVAHEAVYADRRKVEGDKNSVSSRRMVGLIFSTLSSEGLKDALDKLDLLGGLKDAKFVRIEPGTFLMGSPSLESDHENDETQHQVTLTRAFAMQATEVTQEQWFQVTGQILTTSGGAHHPVVEVSWNEVQNFIARLNQQQNPNRDCSTFEKASQTAGCYRLPTEAEWEYSARAGTTTAYSFGNAEGDLGNYAWYFGNSGSQTHEVATKRANAWGLYDMHGNVWEWVQDCYASDLDTAPVTNPQGRSSGSDRSIRGGSWYGSARHLRSANRGNVSPGNRDRNLGFRLSRTL